MRLPFLFLITVALGAWNTYLYVDGSLISLPFAILSFACAVWLLVQMAV